MEGSQVVGGLVGQVLGEEVGAGSRQRAGFTSCPGKQLLDLAGGSPVDTGPNSDAQD